MKKKRVVHKVALTKRKIRFDSTEMLLLVFVALALLVYFAFQFGLLPDFLSRPLVLGASVIR